MYRVGSQPDSLAAGGAHLGEVKVGTRKHLNDSGCDGVRGGGAGGNCLLRHLHGSVYLRGEILLAKVGHMAGRRAAFVLNVPWDRDQ
jgi:hypothetical protein